MPHFETSDGVRLHYRVFGGGGAPLLLLHGLGSDATGYEPMVRSIAARDEAPGAAADPGSAGRGRPLDVVALDLRGHGASAALTDPARYGWFERAARDVVELMDAVGWDAPGLAGGSLGAATAAAVAVRHPERVGRLALMAPAIGAGPELGNPVAAGFVAAVAEQGLIGLLDQLVAAVPDALPAEMEAETRANWARQDDRAMRACARALAAAVLVDDFAALGAIAVPTLVVGQRGDILHPWEMAELYAAAIPGACLEGGEVGFLNDPARPARLLAGFFA